MQNPILPEDEEERLAALRELLILDTEPEERFDRVTQFAATLFQVPIALVSLVDSNRQWFKSRVGLDATETPRDISFCGHAILEDKVMVISNTLDDPRFADNPLVAGGPMIRFYAGAPLTLSNGKRVGTLCLIDSTPRHFDEEQIRQLADLAKVVVRELQNLDTTNCFPICKTPQLDCPCDSVKNPQ